MSVLETIAPTRPNLAAIKQKQHGAWASGDYAIIGATLQIVGENLCEALDLRAGQRVLDVAAGNGNVTLAAARRWCEVTSTDYVPVWLERGRARAAAAGGASGFRGAAAAAVPFAGAGFWVVASRVGVMFTPDQERAAAEMLRVCKSGGKIGLANWTPDGFIGQVFKTLGKYLPPPAGTKSPARWGTREGLSDLFGAGAASISAESRDFIFRYRSAAHFVDVFKAYYGPIHKAVAVLGDDKGRLFLTDLVALIERHNTARDGTIVVPGEYLEVVIAKS